MPRGKALFLLRSLGVAVVGFLVLSRHQKLPVFCEKSCCGVGPAKLTAKHHFDFYSWLSSVCVLRRRVYRYVERSHKQYRRQQQQENATRANRLTLGIVFYLPNSFFTLCLIRLLCCPKKQSNKETIPAPFIRSFLPHSRRGADLVAGSPWLGAGFRKSATTLSDMSASMTSRSLSPPSSEFAKSAAHILSGPR